MIRAFIDASVLFSAMLSKTGFARDLLKLGVQAKVQLVISPFVLAEVERNLKAKFPNRVILFQFIQELLDFELVQPDPKR
ncbi:MAG: PIN domain-containing protein [Anaerolineae bacterium]|nr:PIN domain-containing protein [Anaerolineae bacterium]